MGCAVETTPAVRVTRRKGAAGLERVRYYPRQLLTVEDMLVEQEYFRQKARRHNRMLHGWGVVCGLRVRASPGDGLPWQVYVEEGYALTPQGDEIYVPDPICYDLAKCSVVAGEDLCEPGRPAPPRRDRTPIFLAVRYRECPTRPVRTQPGGCGCDDHNCEYSRIRDDFELGCLLDLPDTHERRDDRRLCDFVQAGEMPACPPCPENPWVVLAAVLLPPKMDEALNDQFIDNRARRVLVSTAMLQEQLIACCCQQG